MFLYLVAGIQYKAQFCMHRHQSILSYHALYSQVKIIVSLRIEDLYSCVKVQHRHSVHPAVLLVPGGVSQNEYRMRYMHSLI